MEQDILQKISGFIVTKITDTGIGMNLSEIDAGKHRPFVFGRHGKSGQKETHGVGLGLSTAATLTEVLCGSLMMKSNT